jgi:hypothetical protein
MFPLIRNSGLRDKARIDRAMRLLRKGALSRATKAMEHKGLGDLDDPELTRQMHDKRPVRIKNVRSDIYTFVPTEEVKVDKIMGKIYNEATQGLARPKNTHARMWMGAFAP